MKESTTIEDFLCNDNDIIINDLQIIEKTVNDDSEVDEEETCDEVEEIEVNPTRSEFLNLFNIIRHLLQTS